MQKYRASGRMSFGGFFLLLVLAVISAAALGGVLFALDYYLHFYLILLFPMFAGAIAGGLLARGVYTAKVRSPIVAGLVGLICGILMYGVYHVASYYVGFRSDVRDSIAQRNGETLSDADLDKFIDANLEKEVGDTGIVGYLKYTAKEGITITNTSSYSSTKSSDTLKGDLVWGYFAVEILLAGLFAAFIAGRAAGEPFDEDANEWYGPPVLFATATGKSRKDLVNALKDANFQQAGTLLTQEDIKYPRVNMNIRRTKNANSTQDVFIQLTYNTRRNRPNNLRNGVVSASEFESIKRGMAQAPSSPTSQ
ncbi:MAG: hypothetical protein GC179_02215 [Anaerolineaceae bacterium]|nr:hypothetical protein [Anaerolineaceae bacterium]